MKIPDPIVTIVAANLLLVSLVGFALATEHAPAPTPTAELTFPPVPFAEDRMPIFYPAPQPVWTLDTSGSPVVAISGSITVEPFAYDFYPPRLYAVPALPVVDANGECVGVADLRAQLARLSARVEELEAHAVVVSTDLSFTFGNGEVVYVKDAAGHGFGLDDGHPFWFSHRIYSRTWRDILAPSDAQSEEQKR